jgi:ATP-binding cassette subfamily F protein uup
MDNLVDHIFVFEENGIVKNYHSTYTEYTRKKILKEKQLKAETKKEEKPIERQKTITNKPTYKQKQEYELLEKEISELETEKEKIFNLMNEGSSDVSLLTQWSERIGEIMKLIDEKSNRWIELSEIME